MKIALGKLKRALASSAVWTPYNPNLEVKIDTDSSKTELGAIILFNLGIINRHID